MLFYLLQTAQMPSPTYQLLSNGTAGSSGDQTNGTNPLPRIQLLSNNVDNVNYYDDNAQVLALDGGCMNAVLFCTD